jgi:His/Glu/Gln/Arg/opine family amino acid ABC transporter permease subunit
MLNVLLANLQLLLEGAAITIELSVVSAALAAVLGLAIAILQVFGGALLRALAETYIYVVRGIPLLVLLFAMYYMLPYTGIDLPPTPGGILVIGAYFAAFMSEVFRGAIVAVPRAQWDAGRGLGMRRWILLSIVILPQAVRLAAPPFVNTCVMLIKSTSLVSIIGLWELTLSGREVVERTLAPFQIFGGVALLYFVICYWLSIYARHLEKRLAYTH